MIKATTFKGKSVALFGLGGSGMATARALVAGGAQVLAADDNQGRMDEAAREGIPVGSLDDADWGRFDSLVLAPGVPLTHPVPHRIVNLANRAGVEIIGDIEVFCRERAARAPGSKLVAITGTNGKSTTTALVAHGLKACGFNVQMGGNIGVAVLSLDELSDNAVYVLECSSYQIDLAPTLDPTIGVLLNISPDHIDRHGSFEHYAAVKRNLVAQSETAVIGIDDETTRSISETLKSDGVSVIDISTRQALGHGLYAMADQLVDTLSGRRHVVTRLTGIPSLRGRHNAQNAAAYAAIARCLGVSYDALAKGLRSFPGLAHRMEEVRRIADIAFVNDSKATNVDAAATALGSFQDIFWIAGGRAKDGGIDELEPFYPRIRKAYLIGEAAEPFAATLGKKVPHEIASTMDHAVVLAARDAFRSGLDEAVVLLSPACASFDQYDNFELRGDAFRKAVEALDLDQPKAEAL
ncbi:UDP-N-acetylmuramoyl-L-alanine--D-glutamate ligase [Coralliovum pocilloporae]|uniref:UDP-N-acetylmuramoyl-L-alanine--D-glutamate ligase n=1 Tax=Coralliovum pocilloporae TaxID=3066369 RepID=UPI0033077999